MAKNATRYYATYCRLVETSGDSGIMIDGNQWTVGTELELTPQLHITERGKEVPRVVLGCDGRAAGFVPEDTFKQLKKCLDDGLVCRAFVTFVVFDKLKDQYWVQAAIFCYEKKDEAVFEPFVQAMVKRIAKGEYPNVNLSEKELDRVLSSAGSWSETKSLQRPDLPKGSAYYKTKQTFAERMAQDAMNGKRGRVIASAVGILVAIVAVVLLIASIL